MCGSKCDLCYILLLFSFMTFPCIKIVLGEYIGRHSHSKRKGDVSVVYCANPMLLRCVNVFIEVKIIIIKKRTRGIHVTSLWMLGLCGLQG